MSRRQPDTKPSNAKQLAGYAKSADRRRENNRPRELEEIRPLLKDAAAMLKALARRTKRPDYRALSHIAAAVASGLYAEEVSRHAFDEWLTRLVTEPIDSEWPAPKPDDAESAACFHAAWARATASNSKPEGA